jgi:hypothetical protein
MFVTARSHNERRRAARCEFVMGMLSGPHRWCLPDLPPSRLGSSMSVGIWWGKYPTSWPTRDPLGHLLKHPRVQIGASVCGAEGLYVP